MECQFYDMIDCFGDLKVAWLSWWERRDEASWTKINWHNWHETLKLSCSLKCFVSSSIFFLAICVNVKLFSKDLLSDLTLLFSDWIGNNC